MMVARRRMSLLRSRNSRGHLLGLLLLLRGCGYLGRPCYRDLGCISGDPGPHYIDRHTKEGASGMGTTPSAPRGAETLSTPGGVEASLTLGGAES